MADIPLPFANTHIPFMIYILLVGFVIFIEFLMAVYIWMWYHFGKPMAPFFWRRIQRWFDPTLSLFEIITLAGSIFIEDAKEERGGVFRQQGKSVKPVVLREPVPARVAAISVLLALSFAGLSSYALTYYQVPLQSAAQISLIWFIIPLGVYLRRGTKVVPQPQTNSHPAIITKSTYTVNGVPTLLLWDLHPPLHETILRGLGVLNDQEITGYEQLQEKAGSSPETELFPGQTYKTFLELLDAARKKYEVVVKVEDVTDFVSKHFDESYQESITAKEFNTQSKRKIENKFMIYGYIALIATIVGVLAFKIAKMYLTGGAK